MLKRIHVFVAGRVQGVAFRWMTENVALNLGIVGWVRNLLDGRVEIMAEGERNILQEFIEFLKKGPRYAKVKSIEIDWLEYKGEFNTFDIHF